MASLFKPTIVRWVGPDGRRCDKTATGAKKVTTEAAKWYAKGVPGWPKGKKVPLATDKRVAARMLAELVERAERGLASLPDRKEAARPLAPLVDEFRAALLRRGGEKHAD